MGWPLQQLQRFFRELKRRNVYKVAVSYAVVAFVTLQAAQLIFPATTLEGLYDKLVVLAFVGFPISLVLAWAFEMTPEGMRRTETPEGEESLGAGFQWIGLSLVAVLAGGVWYLAAGDSGAPTSETAAEREGATAKSILRPDSAAPRLGGRSIAVLPFAALGQDEPGTFTEGMHDALLTRLSNISGLRVISRTSVQQYRGTDKRASEIARELGVKWILEGGVQEMSNQIQVNAQLIDARNDTHAWAESYRRTLTTENLFDIQTEITRRIASSLEARVTAGEELRLEHQPTGDLDAYRSYLKGRSHWNRHTEEDWRTAAEYYREAIASDSTYAPPFAGLADAIIRLAFFGHQPPTDAYRRARELALRALELDEQLAEAHTTLGRIRYLYDWDFDGAEEEFDRALELNPNYAPGYHAYGVMLARLGRFGEARNNVDRALQLDPVMPRFNNNRAWIAFLARRYREAVELYGDAIKLNPGFAMSHRELAWAYVETEGYQDAIREAERALELSPDDYTLASFGFVAGRAGQQGRARSALDSLSKRAERRYVSPTNLALIHLGLGNYDRALDWLEDAARERSAFLVNLGVHPFFDPLRGRPRFQDLLERMGLDTMAIDLDTLVSHERQPEAD